MIKICIRSDPHPYDDSWGMTQFSKKVQCLNQTKDLKVCVALVCCAAHKQK